MRHESCNVRERGECDDVRERHVCDGAGGSGQDEMSSTKAGMLLATNCPLQATGTGAVAAGEWTAAVSSGGSIGSTSSGREQQGKRKQRQQGREQ